MGQSETARSVPDWPAADEPTVLANGRRSMPATATCVGIVRAVRATRECGTKVVGFMRIPVN